MSFFTQLFQNFILYSQELWWSVLLGFFLSGVFNEFIPSNIVDKYLSKDGLKPILISSLIGVILPVCCFGSLPIAVTLHKRGAKLGPVLAFLIATPATSITALIVCLKLLGWLFTSYIFFAVIIMGILIGFLGNSLKMPVQERNEENSSCCPNEEHEEGQSKTFAVKVKDVFRYAFITLPKAIGLELLLGVLIASFLITFQPLQNFIQQYLIGSLGYLFVLLFGLTTYVCSTASVPLADALIKAGLSAGQSLTYLLVGPITSLGTLLVIYKEFRLKILIVYLVFISAFSLLFGVVFDVLALQ